MAVKTSEPLTLGEALLSENLIDQEQFNEALAEYQAGKKTFAHAIVSSGAITEGMKLGVFQKKLKIPVVPLANVKLSPMAADRVPRDICEKFHLVAYEIEGSDLHIAMEDPTDQEAVKFVRSLADMPLKISAAKSAEIMELIKQIPQKAVAKAKSKKKKGKLLSTLFLIVMTFLPILILIVLLITNKSFGVAFTNLQLEPFERVLVFIMTMSLWASAIYFINDFIFPSDDEDDEPEYIP